jgi:hypothetical protein
MSFRVGRILNINGIKYEIGAQLGKGSYAKVYEGSEIAGHKSNLRKNSIDNYFETEPSLWPLKRNNLKAVEFFKLLLRASLRCFHQQI